MKLAACFLTLLPGFAVAASWTSPGFPAFSEQGTGTFVSHAHLHHQAHDCTRESTHLAELSRRSAIRAALPRRARR